MIIRKLKTMNFNIKSINILAIAILFLFSSCGHDHSEDDGHDHGSEDEHGHEAESRAEQDEHEEGIHLTQEQIKTIDLKFGDFEEIKINDFIKTTGTLGLPPNAYASVSAKANGIIKGNNKFVEGNFIKKGEIIAYLENPDFILKQQEYLETLPQLELKRKELQRQNTLVNANAGVNKILENAQAEVAILQAKTNGLAKQLSYLGINVKSLSPYNISQQIAITAPMSGFISSINLNNGMYAVSNVPLMEIISDEHLHLELDVFEKDISKLKIGQKISYSIPALGTEVFEGEISVMGKEFNTQGKTIRVHGHLDGKKPMFIKDLFINAKIWLNDATVTALPEKAVIREGQVSFIFVGKEDSTANEIDFEKIMVIAGATENGYIGVKLLSEIPKGMKIVTHGAYFVYAQSMAGELEHDH